jgi:hypothetical protein
MMPVRMEDSQILLSRHYPSIVPGPPRQAPLSTITAAARPRLAQIKRTLVLIVTRDQTSRDRADLQAAGIAATADILQDIAPASAAVPRVELQRIVLAISINVTYCAMHKTTKWCNLDLGT